MLDLLLMHDVPAAGAQEAAADPEDWRRMAIEYNRPALRTAPWPFLPEDLRQVESIAANVARIATGETMKFIIGQRPLSEYDQFLGELEEAGASKLLKMLNTRAVPLDLTSLWDPLSQE